MKLVFDGGCPFCRHFAELSELRGGVPQLEIVDGRADRELRQWLAERGCPLARGAVLIDGDELFHGAEAISRLCAALHPSAPLLALLRQVFAGPERTRRLYPLLLLARRLALGWRGLPVDPDDPPPRAQQARTGHNGL
ncbi:DUF393 domain-containing protein [Synechococcus sp. RSCCF101]|uniref:DCC1-like thiol-disulfide oxidoreductase family protein n=1 Tax=Synechococcus sp. RSCCF101 TaxID=2511069 RepID=UPI001248881D|nr:DCC1-like thiol-disulfide oxidoreductase family protein [Synechococcus sp. RSCCF101]QEY31080.1 DUF393 domain-containing protein [Synechococcus sp. RSCCF101]